MISDLDAIFDITSEHSHVTQALAEALAAYWHTYLNIDLGKITSISKQGLGYNIQGTQKYYWHRPEQDAATPFVWLAFSYQVSNRCPDRLDIKHILDLEHCLINHPHGDLWQALLHAFANHDDATQHWVIQCLLKRTVSSADLQAIQQQPQLMQPYWQAVLHQSQDAVWKALLENDGVLDEVWWWQWLHHSLQDSKATLWLEAYVQKNTHAHQMGWFQVVTGQCLADEWIQNSVWPPQHTSWLLPLVFQHPQVIQLLQKHADILKTVAIATIHTCPLPTDTALWPNILDILPAPLQDGLAQHHADSHFPIVGLYIHDENVLLHHVMVQNSPLAIDFLEALWQKSYQQGWLHLWYVLVFLRWEALKKPVTMANILTLNRNYMEALFKKHSEPLQKLNSPIFPPCFVQENPSYSTSNHPKKLKKLTLCEGKVWYLPQQPKSDQQTDEEPCKHTVIYHKQPIATQKLPKIHQQAPEVELKVVCRRKDCDAYDIYHRSIYQRLLQRVSYSGLDSLMQLSQDKAETQRQIGALNRWNEIITRLKCRSCGAVLRLSEHSPNSVGKMAYAATYWHCSNLQCATHMHSIKISHCIGCGKVIDNRDDRQSCTPFQTLSYKKFYICNECGCCCKPHSHFIGKCPACGIDNAYVNVTEKQRTQASCRDCGHQISIDKRAFSQYQQKQHQPTNGTQQWPLTKTHFERQHAIGVDLYAVDLYQQLIQGTLKPSDLLRYSRIFDLKILNKMFELGKHHPRYVSAGFESQPYHCDDEQWEDTIPEDWKRYFIEVADYMTEQDMFQSHYSRIELPFTLALFTYTQGGIKISPSLLQKLYVLLEQGRNRISFAMQDKHGFFTNQEAVMEEYVQHLSLLRTQLGSKREPLLDALAAECELEDLAHAWKALEKMERVSKLLQAFVQAPDHCVLPHYQIIGSVTGRCTAKNPAILSFPKVFRSVFAHQPGYELYSFDYGQIEIGVLAALSQDAQLIADYNQTDVYQTLADQTQLSREQAKMLMLSVVYGISNPSLHKLLNLPISSIEALKQQWFERYSHVDAYRQQCQQQLQQQGFVHNQFGLRRYANRTVRLSDSLQAWEHNWAFNFPVQSTAAAIFKLALVTIHEQDHRRSLRMVCPLYDEFLVLLPVKDVAYYIDLIQNSMVWVLQTQLPVLKAKVSVEHYHPNASGEYHCDAWQTWLDEL